MTEIFRQIDHSERQAVNADITKSKLSGYRYRKDSYKARKLGLQPIRAMIKGTFPAKTIRFRIYGTPDTQMTKPQEAGFHAMLATVKQSHNAMLKAGLIKEYHHTKQGLEYR